MSRESKLRLIFMTPNKCVATAAVMLIAVLASISAPAQSSGGSLSGSVSDHSNAKIVQAAITVTNVETNVARTVTTNRTGSYSLPNLRPGAYVVDASAPGFGAKHLTGITIAVGTAQVLDITLDVAAHVQQVVVPANVEDLQMATSDISAFVGGETIRNLPLNGRSWFDLAVLQPGATAIQTQPSFVSGTDRGSRGFGSELTISGARPQQNNYLLNGTSLNDYANSAGSVTRWKSRR